MKFESTTGKSRESGQVCLEGTAYKISPIIALDPFKGEILPMYCPSKTFTCWKLTLSSTADYFPCILNICLIFST